MGIVNKDWERKGYAYKQGKGIYAVVGNTKLFLSPNLFSNLNNATGGDSDYVVYLRN